MYFIINSYWSHVKINPYLPYGNTFTTCTYQKIKAISGTPLIDANATQQQEKPSEQFNFRRSPQLLNHYRLRLGDIAYWGKPKSSASKPGVKRSLILLRASVFWLVEQIVQNHDVTMTVRMISLQQADSSMT